MNNLDKDPEEDLKEDDIEFPEDLPNEEIEEFSNAENEVESIGLKSSEIADDNDNKDSIDEVVETSEESFNEETTESGIAKEESLKEQLREFHKNLIEASLYAAGRPLNIEELSNKLEFPKKEVEVLVNEVAFDYLDRSTALVIAQIGDRYQMQIKPEYTEKVAKFAKGGAIAERYLRTLTIIALKQPILKSTVIRHRGTGAYEHIKYLIDNGFINADKKGRSHELTTTDKYADMFGLPKDKRLLKQAMITQLGIEESPSVDHSEQKPEQDKIEEE
ncbi:MAG: SMC-Scp complex subunit ScpB [Candidatus Lokiarchaeota archaeon]|nr:SMC-Scp complex subunit ScpB [Candidatus Lokiarchaeota archaeon]